MATYTFKINHDKNNVTMRHVTKEFKLQHVGRRGPQGEPGQPGLPGQVLVQSVNGKQGVVVIDKADIGLGNVDNTSDSNKPVSTAMQVELEKKQYKFVKTVGEAPADYVTDGVNDEVQWNQAITDAFNQGGGKLLAKDSEYYVGVAPIQLKSNVWIEGMGVGKTTFYGTSTLGNNAVMLGSGTTVSNPLTDCTISNLSIDGSSMPTSPVSTFRKGIDVIFTLRMRVFNVRIYNTPATGFGPDCNVDLQIDNCIFDECGTLGQNPGFNGLGIGTGFYENESCLVTNSVARNCHNNGFLLEYVGGGFNSKDYQFTNCYAIGNKRAYRISGCSGATFTNCKAIDSLNEGFYIHMFGAAVAYPQDCTINSCDIYGNGGDGIYIKEQEAQQSGHIVSMNHIHDNAGSGVVSGSSTTKIISNLVHDNGKTGIYVHAFSSTTLNTGDIKDNTAYNNAKLGVAGTTEGIRVYGELGTVDGMKITGNTCFDTQTPKTQLYGIVVKGLITNLLVNFNDLRNNSTAPILNTISPSDPSNQLFENVGTVGETLSNAVTTALADKVSKTANETIGGNKTFTGQLGFFSASPVSQQSATTDIGTVLANLGLRASGTAWPITTGGTITFTAAQRSPGVARTGAVTLTTTSAKNSECNATTAPFTITLPSPTSQAGLTFHFIKTDASANAVLISGTGVSHSLTAQNKYAEVRVNAGATSWLVTSSN